MEAPKLSSILQRFTTLNGAKSAVSSSIADIPGLQTATAVGQEAGNAIGAGLPTQNQGQAAESSLSGAFSSDPAASPRALDASDDSRSSPKIYYRTAGSEAVLRAGEQYANWRNPYICYAMPVILRLQRYLNNEITDRLAMRAQLALEVRLFRERLSTIGGEPKLVDDASYLLCTYIDEAVNDSARKEQQTPYDGDRSLLVEFHGDAWGGEDAFAHLEYWMKSASRALPLDLLALHELILSLGWQGRYRAIERGNVLLQDLRSQLHAQIWQHQAPAALGSDLFNPPAYRQRWWTTGRAVIAVLAGVLLLYALATFDLDSRGLPIREALAAWSPPVRTIDISQTLPPPLPELLAEGWLSAYKQSNGWLLVFRSDGAFDVGQAKFRPEFLRNIERLGLAFAPWPGDLEVIGHTDRQPINGGSFTSNQALSEARARTVADELRGTALSGGGRAPANARQRQIEFSGRGDTEPVDPAGTQAAFSRNRRVDILWRLAPPVSSQTDAQSPRQNTMTVR